MMEESEGYWNAARKRWQKDMPKMSEEQVRSCHQLWTDQIMRWDMDPEQYKFYCDIIDMCEKRFPDLKV